MRTLKPLLGLAVAAFLIPAASASADRSYAVKPGETWATVTTAQCRAGVQPAQLAQMNSLSVATPLRGGQAINIPSSLDKARTAKLQSFQGSVTVNGAAAQRNQTLNPNDTLATAAGAAADVVLDNGSVMRVGANTRITITQLAMNGNSTSTGTQLANGSVTMQVTRLNHASSFTVSTVSAVAGVRGTYFYISFDEATQNVGVACYSGRVDIGQPVTGPNGETLVNPTGAVAVPAGHAATIDGATNAVSAPFPIPGRIEWADAE